MDTEWLGGGTGSETSHADLSQKSDQEEEALHTRPACSLFSNSSRTQILALQHAPCNVEQGRAERALCRHV